MSTKKCFVALIVAICLAATVQGQRGKNPNEKVELLQEKIKCLEKTIKFQQKKYGELKADYGNIKKQLDEQIKENEKLKALVKNIDTDVVTESVKSKFNPNDGIIYLGKQRDKLWFYRMYNRFYDKIASVNGKYYDIQEGVLNPSMINEGFFLIGIVAKTPNKCKVYKTLTSGEVVVIRPASQRSSIIYQPALRYGYRPASSTKYVDITPELLFHVKGIIDNVTVGSPFSMNKLISIGSYAYGDRKIQSFAIYEPLTKEQFVDALKSGIRLIVRREINGKIIETPIR